MDKLLFYNIFSQVLRQAPGAAFFRHDPGKHGQMHEKTA
jgi:hypothetical protein